MAQTTTPAVSTWIALFRAQKRARSAIDAALKSANLPPLEQYDVLWALEQALPEGLRPFELEQSVLLPQHGISRLTTQMATQDLLTRLPCSDDKRGFRLVPTSTGLQLRQDMWQVYQPVIKIFFGPQLNQEDIQNLTQLLNRSG
ncbi:MAG: MarR family transcriptional regulator [Rhodobacteraceae bacterium]|nr:MAG: MarR family transcriptional regulator [Paracoccaceae bacterium]